MTGSSLASAEGNTITGLGLSATGVTVGNYGSSTAIPIVTVLEDGRISSASTTSVATTLSTEADTGTGTVDLLTDNLLIKGTTNEVDTSATGRCICIGLPSAVLVTTSISSPLLSGTNLYTDGKVGICNSNPNHALSVTGNISATGDAFIDGDLTVAGEVTYTASTVTATTTAFQDNFLLESTDSGSSGAPDITLYRNSSSPANDDDLGNILFRGRNNNTQDVEYAQILTDIVDVADGSEDAKIRFLTMTAGTLTDTLAMDRGKVGIGTINPTVDLEVYNASGTDTKIRIDSNATGNAILEIDRQTSGASALVRFQDSSSTTWDIGNYGNTHFDFRENGSTIRMRIEDGGNVGIGTTDPSANLHIYGAGEQSLFVGSSNASRAIIELDGAANGDGAGEDYAYLAHEADGSFNIKNLQNNSMNFSTGSSGSTRMTITSAGTVGIGTTAPLAKLDVTGIAAANIFQLSKSGALIGASIQLTNQGGDASSNDLTITTNHSTNSIVLRAAQTVQLYTYSSGYQERLRIAHNGNVGIGTTVPDGKLHAHTATAGIVAAHTTADDLVVENSVAGGISILTPDATDSNIYFGSPTDSAGAYIRWNHDADLLNFGTLNAGGEVAFMSDNGTLAYTITSGGGLNQARTTGNNFYGIGLLRSGSGLANPDLWPQCNDGFVIGGTGSTADLVIDSNGKVGIGTVAPGYNLHVSCSSGAAAIGITGTGGSKDTWSINSSDTGDKAILAFTDVDTSSTILTLHQDNCVLPGSDNAVSLGSSSKRWANVYANCTTTGAVIESNLCTNGLDSCPEGSVVIWRDGKLQGTTDAYSHRVMGVTAPGSESPIVMGAENILVTGDIEEGDPIVTSDKYNHGMRGARSEGLHGKVIAEALERGSGESYIIRGMIRKF